MPPPHPPRQPLNQFDKSGSIPDVWRSATRSLRKGLRDRVAIRRGSEATRKNRTRLRSEQPKRSPKKPGSASATTFQAGRKTEAQPPRPARSPKGQGALAATCWRIRQNAEGKGLGWPLFETSSAAVAHPKKPGSVTAATYRGRQEEQPPGPRPPRTPNCRGALRLCSSARHKKP